MSSLTSVANATILKDQGVIVSVKKGFTTQDIIDAILVTEKEKASALQVKSFAPYLQGDNDYTTLYNIWYFVRNEIKYIADGFKYEDVKTPAAVWDSKFADCKSLSIFEASLLRHFPQFTIIYRFASYDKKEPENFSHVYIVVKGSNGREIILDSVHSRFDEEVPYVNKKDYKVRELRIIRGLPNLAGVSPGAVPGPTPNILPKVAPTKEEAFRDGPKQVINLPAIPIANLSQGELKLRLIDQQLDLLIGYYGDPRGYFSKAKSILRSALSVGLQNYIPVGVIAPELYNLVSSIEHAKRLDSQHIQIDNFGISGPELDKAEQECVSRFNPIERSDWWLFWHSHRKEIVAGKKYDSLKDEAFYQCLRSARLKDLAVTNYFDTPDYKKGSHHLLYNFMDARKYESKLSAFGGGKVNGQRQAVSVLSNISGLDRDNVELYTRNGIIHTSSKLQLPDVSPEGNIELLSNASQLNNPAKIGVLSPGMLDLLKGLGVALVAAIPAIILALKDKGQELKDQSEGIGTPEFGPEETDWQAGINSLSTSNYILGGLGVAIAGYLLFNKSKSK